jgi:peptidyl-prolyl cis-trans isomerase SurA
MKLLIIFSLCLSVHAKLLDKVSAVIDDNTVTLSMVKRIKNSLAARKNISPFIYKKASYTDKELNELIVRRYIIRSKLQELGYGVTDEQVESEVKNRETKLGLSRDQLITFLKNNGTNYEEFFEITREAIEFNRFNSVVILPLISVSEQEIKNQFFQDNVNNKTVSFKYNLVDFSIDPSLVPKKEWKQFREKMIKFQKTGNLPSKYSSIETNTLGDISEEGLTKDLKSLIHKAEEGSFTNPIVMFGKVHIFFIKSRNVVESETYIKSKPMLRARLYEKKANEVTSVWFEREEANHYIKKFL